MTKAAGGAVLSGPELLRGVRVALVRLGPVEFDKRTTQTARLLAEAGANVTVICSASPARTWDDSTTGVRYVQVCPGPASAHPVRTVRIGSNLLRMLRGQITAYRSIRHVAPDVVHCVNVDAIVISWLAGVGKPAVYEAREHFATTGSPRAWVRAWWMFKERRFARRAARVITVSRPIAADMARRYRIAQPAVIYSGSLEVVDEPTPVCDPLRVLHLGKYFLDRGLSELVDAVGRVPGVELTIQGWGEAEAELRNRICAAGLDDRVRLVPPCTPDRLTAVASQYDVGVLNLSPDNDSHRWAAPNKLFDYMSSGLAVLAPDLPVIGGIVTEARCGRLFAAGDDQDLLCVLRDLADSPEQVRQLKSNARSAAVTFTWDNQAGVLYEAYAAARRRRAGKRAHGE